MSARKKRRLVRRLPRNVASGAKSGRTGESVLNEDAAGTVLGTAVRAAMNGTRADATKAGAKNAEAKKAGAASSHDLSTNRGTKNRRNRVRSEPRSLTIILRSSRVRPTIGSRDSRLMNLKSRPAKSLKPAANRKKSEHKVAAADAAVAEAGDPDAARNRPRAKPLATPPMATMRPAQSLSRKNVRSENRTNPRKAVAKDIRRDAGGGAGGVVVRGSAEEQTTSAREDQPNDADRFLAPGEVEDLGELGEPAAERPHRRSHEESEDFDRDDEGDDEPREGKHAPRDIPTWKEVIGLIIDGNMEARARSPNKGGGAPYRGRGSGGRGHNGDRGHNGGRGESGGGSRE